MKNGRTVPKTNAERKADWKAKQPKKKRGRPVLHLTEEDQKEARAKTNHKYYTKEKKQKEGGYELDLFGDIGQVHPAEGYSPSGVPVGSSPK